MQADETKKPSAEISEIDGKPIVTISAADFYQANSEYINEVVERLSHNGDAVVEAVTTQYESKRSKFKQANANPEAVIVGLSELKSTSSYKAKSTDKKYSLDDLSSHIQVVSDDGSFEQFEVILEPHRGTSKIAKPRFAKINKKTTWLALNPDHFYVQENDQGNEIWPVTFPAVSVDDPDHEIEVTLDRDGTLTWPRDVKMKSASTSGGGSANEMIYVSGLAYMQPCIEGPQGGCTGGGGSGGGGDSGGGGSGGSGGDGEVPELQNVNSPILSIKTIRLDGTGDGSGGAELQMHVDPVTSEDPFRFERKWEYTFDYKWGEKGLPIAFGDGGFFEVLGGLLLWITDRDLANSIETGSIFKDRNTRTYGLDMRIYETPDVNSELVNYHFTNMRTWEERLPFPPDIQIDYEEIARQDYFPAVLLNGSTFRILLMENDTDYPEASGNFRTILGHDVQTYDMGTGNYSNVYTEIESDWHDDGSSDDLMWHSGVRNINFSNANLQADSNGEIVAVSPDDFMWEFVITQPSVPTYSSND